MKKSNRICGECSACCFVAEVKEGIVNKPACTTCPFLNRGCTLYANKKRPQVCREFQCSWLRGFGSDNDRPDKSGVMVSINHMNGGTWINVMELTPGAYNSTGKNMIKELAATFDIPVIIVTHDNLEKGMGDYVIIKKSLEQRSKKIMGDFVSSFASDMNVYKLIISPPSP